MNKKLRTAAAAVLLALVLAGGAELYAYLQATDREGNQFLIPEDKVEVVETFAPASGPAPAPTPTPDPNRITAFDVIVYSESVQTVELDGTVYDSGTDPWKRAWTAFLGTP